MTGFPRRSFALLSFFLAALSTGASARAETGAAPRNTVLELFTSQSCSSCPRAEAVLSRVAERADVVALEWHVDYWDDLVHGRSGRWKDPFSDPAFTRRQRTYNENLRGTRNVYTPQLVVAGRTESPGFDQAAIEAQLERRARDGEDFSLTVDGTWPDGFTIRLDGTVPGPEDAAPEIWFVDFLPKASTKVRGGENHGRTLANLNVVRAITKVGAWTGGKAQFTVNRAPVAPEARCAVLLQRPGTGAVLSGQYCPA